VGLGLGVALGWPYWGYPYWGYYGYPYYGDAYYPAYAGPAYSYEAAPTEYTERPAAAQYYCTDPAGYYPNVQNCRKEWLRVLPEGGSPGAPPPRPTY
jgi:hypothetical protein